MLGLVACIIRWALVCTIRSGLFASCERGMVVGLLHQVKRGDAVILCVQSVLETLETGGGVPACFSPPVQLLMGMLNKLSTGLTLAQDQSTRIAQTALPLKPNSLVSPQHNTCSTPPSIQQRLQAHSNSSPAPFRLRLVVEHSCLCVPPCATSSSYRAFKADHATYPVLAQR